MGSPADELERLTAVLRSQKISYALIGGWAVVSWGYLRASDDIDLLVELPSAKRKALLESLAGDWDAEWVPGGEGDPVPGLIRAAPKKGGLPFDLLPARKTADLSALSDALTVSFDKLHIPVVRPEDLIAMKLEAGGGQDYQDVRRLLQVLGEKLDEARLAAACARRKVTDRLKLARAA